MLSISYDEVRQLYFQNPQFGFYFLRLASERLFENMERMEEEIARLRVALPEVETVRKRPQLRRIIRNCQFRILISY